MIFGMVVLENFFRTILLDEAIFRKAQSYLTLFNLFGSSRSHKVIIAYYKQAVQIEAC